MNVEQILIAALKSTGADGLWNGEDVFGDGEPCGCGFDDIAPCLGLLDFPRPVGCVPAKRGEDGLYHPIWDQDQIATIVDLWTTDHTILEIARSVGGTRAGINSTIARLRAEGLV